MPMPGQHIGPSRYVVIQQKELAYVRVLFNHTWKLYLNWVCKFGMALTIIKLWIAYTKYRLALHTHTQKDVLENIEHLRNE